MNPINLLRYGWSPSAVRLLLAASADSGPCNIVQWARRSRLERTNTDEVIRYLQKHGAMRREDGPDGACLYVLEEEFWDPALALCSAEEFAEAWRPNRQGRLDLSTEEPTLAQALRAELSAGQPPQQVVVNYDNSPRPPAGGVGGAVPRSNISGASGALAQAEEISFQLKAKAKAELSCPESGQARGRSGAPKLAGLRNALEIRNECERAIGPALRHWKYGPQWQAWMDHELDLVEYALDELSNKQKREVIESPAKFMAAVIRQAQQERTAP